jgi:DNA uptake protein ComE-like DNA-binding protein
VYALMIAAILAPAIASPRVLAQAGSSSSQSAATSAAKTGTATASQKLDINSARKEELDALPASAKPTRKKSSPTGRIAPSAIW